MNSVGTSAVAKKPAVDYAFYKAFVDMIGTCHAVTGFAAAVAEAKQVAAHDVGKIPSVDRNEYALNFKAFEAILDNPVFSEQIEEPIKDAFDAAITATHAAIAAAGTEDASKLNELLQQQKKLLA